MKINMNSKLILIFVAISFYALFGCDSKSKNTETTNEETYDAQFSQLINQLDQPVSLRDTLYVEMCIAMKTLEKDSTYGDIVLDRVDKLLSVDDIAENRRHYLEAASIVYGMRQDYEKYWQVSKQIFDTYPADSFQRLSSYASYYTNVEHNADSASYYIASAKNAANDLKESNNSEDRMGYCIGMAMLYILEGNDGNAKLVIQEFINQEKESENIEAAKELLNDFEQFKAYILRSSTMY